MTGHIKHEMLLEDHRTDGLRSGEGCAVLRKDGALCLIYGRFQGPGDHDPADLVKRCSEDGGITWSAPEVVRRTPSGGRNVMSVSLLRLADGRIGCAYLDKRSTLDCRPRFMVSGDETRTWSEPQLMVERQGYYVVNNDRLVQLSSGRLLAPYAYYEPRAIERGGAESLCGCLISDDAGASWRLGAVEQGIHPDQVLRPRRVDTTNPQVEEFLSRRRIVAQEPGVIELDAGRVMMWVRTTGGYAYRCYSEDGGDTWSAFQAITEFAMPCGPQSIWRLPDGKRLIMLYNDRGQVPFGTAEFHWRTPLSVAVSDDQGDTWQPHAPLEADETHSYCYFSLMFFADRALCTYYLSSTTTDENGVRVRRNLSSLKVTVVATRFFR